MYDLMEKDLLAKVDTYKLFRGKNSLFISVYEVIAGESRVRFMAQPNMVVKVAPSKYYGEGNTGVDALKDCLTKIKGKEFDTIFS